MKVTTTLAMNRDEWNEQTAECQEAHEKNQAVDSTNKVIFKEAHQFAAQKISNC